MYLKPTLRDYLKGLISSEDQWGLYVNPEDIDDYRIGQTMFENGGVKDGFRFVGTLDNLSCGSQSIQDAVVEYIREGYFAGPDLVVFKKKLIEAYNNDKQLDDDFVEFLEDKAKPIMETWAELEADFVIEQIKSELANS